MNIPMLGLPLSSPLPGRLKNKRVLLLDSTSTTRDLRAETMRKLGMDVDCAADISEARSWWRADLYNLVLIDTPTEPKNTDKFCEDLRRATPPQPFAFLVGKPGYLGNIPRTDSVATPAGNGNAVPQDLVRAALAADLPGAGQQRWGILEASRRISEVRGLSHAKTMARQDRSAPARDMESREFKRNGGGSRSLDDLLREEMQ